MPNDLTPLHWAFSPATLFGKQPIPEEDIPEFDLAEKGSVKRPVPAGPLVPVIRKLQQAKNFKLTVISPTDGQKAKEQMDAIHDSGVNIAKNDFRTISSENPAWQYVPDDAFFLSTSDEVAMEAAKNGKNAGSVHGGQKIPELDHCHFVTDLDGTALDHDTNDRYHKVGFVAAEQYEADHPDIPHGQGPVLKMLKAYHNLNDTSNGPKKYQLSSISSRSPKMAQRAKNSLAFYGLPPEKLSKMDFAGWDANKSLKPNHPGDVFFEDRPDVVAKIAKTGRLAVQVYDKSGR